MDKYILLVEDDRDDQQLFTGALKSLGHDISYRIASTAEECLAFLKNATVWPGLIVIDVSLPGMDGMDLLIQLKKLDQVKHIPVVVLTTAANADLMNTMLLMGADYFFTKPVSYMQVLEVVEDMLSLQLS